MKTIRLTITDEQAASVRTMARRSKPETSLNDCIRMVLKLEPQKRGRPALAMVPCPRCEKPIAISLVARHERQCGGKR